MLTPEARQERDPSAIQMELLEIDRRMAEIGPELQQATEEYQHAKATWEIRRTELKLLKDRRSSLQSVLKSISQF